MSEIGILRQLTTTHLINAVSFGSNCSRRRRAKPASFVQQRGVQAETSQRNLLMMDTLDHLGSTIRPNCIFAFPQVTVSYEKFHARM